MHLGQQKRLSSDRRRIFAVALALFALALQSLAPLQIAPPRGDIVHFAHSHRAPHGDAKKSGAPHQDTHSCPVCHALQAAGSAIEAAYPLTPIVGFAPAAGVPLVHAEPFRQRPLSAHRARAPPAIA
jgi:hypothetical protein